MKGDLFSCEMHLFALPTGMRGIRMGKLNIGPLI